MAKAFRCKSDAIVNRLKSPVSVVCSDKSFNVIALWDTGATLCCVSEEVISELSLTASGKTRVSTPSSSGELVDTYLVDLLLPNNVLVKDVCVAKSKIGAQGIGLLIGMDIISQGDFLITNSGETVFSFRMPSEPLPDFVAGINFRNIVEKKKSKPYQTKKRKR